MTEMTTVQQILADPALVPHIEERALRFSMHRFVMASRVLTYSDMQGWNVRKVSIYHQPSGARQLSEGVEIPSNKIIRKRLAEIEPLEWGDRFPITNRRTSTDPEPVLADTIEFLGYSLGVARERQLMAAALECTGGYIGSPTTDYALGLAIQLQTEFSAKAYSGRISHVIHPYQELTVMKELVDLNKTAVPDFRNQFIRQWNFGGFGGLNIAVSSFVPRKVLSRIVLSNVTDGDKIKLSIGGKTTADITLNTTVATTVTAISDALNALGLGTFTVTAPGVASLANINVQSPVFLIEEQQLAVALDTNGDEDVVFADPDGSVVVQEISGVARAPFFERTAIVLDIRQPIDIYQEWKPAYRTLDIGGTEVYGVGTWDAKRGYFVETVATSPLAVPNP